MVGAPESRVRPTGRPGRRRRAPWGRGAVWGLVLAGATVLQLLRQAGNGPWRTVWAEDGGVFYSGTPSVTHLLDPHAGYAQLVPRVVGLSAHWVPLLRLSWYDAIAGAAVTTLCALAVWAFTRDVVESTALRALLAASVVLLPSMILEQLGNGVNTIWALAFAAWWAVLSRPRSTKEALAPAAVLSVAVLSQALALAYAPVVAYTAWRRRDRPAYVVAAAFAVSAVVQLAVVAGASDDTPTTARHLGDLPKIYAVRVLGSALVSERRVGDVWDAMHGSFAVLAVLLVALAVAGLARLASRNRAIALVTIGYSVGLWVVCVWGRGTVGMRIPAAGYNSIGTRWTSLSIWFLLSGLVLLADGVPARRARTLAVGILAAQFAVVAALGFRGSNPRSDAPTWAATIRAASAGCRTENAGHRISLLVAPPAPAFAVVVRCSDL
ncbi:MAG TPA: hypothetical protein VFC99_11865 [Acidimicrobiia bacterium]|nr:hypothetical protein [Acidimicrobiia bacterium]